MTGLLCRSGRPTSQQGDDWPSWQEGAITHPLSKGDQEACLKLFLLFGGCLDKPTCHGRPSRRGSMLSDPSPWAPTSRALMPCVDMPWCYMFMRLPPPPPVCTFLGALCTYLGAICPYACPQLPLCAHTWVLWVHIPWCPVCTSSPPTCLVSPVVHAHTFIVHARARSSPPCMPGAHILYARACPSCMCSHAPP